MTGNNNKVVQIFSINVESDQDYQRYTSRRKSSVVREISGRIHSVLNREEEVDVDVSIDGVFRFNGQIDVNNVVPTSSQPSVEAQHFQRRGSSLTNGETVVLPEISQKAPRNVRKWLVLFSSFINLMITGGFPFNMSVLFVEFLNEFGKTKAETSLVQSVCTGVFFIGGIITGTLVSKFGTKVCGCAGALLSAVGIGVCFTATNLEFLIICIGVVAGAGFSLNIICASTSISQNFSGKEKVLALAIASTGSGMGGLSFPLILQYLIDQFGWRGCLMVISGLVFNQVACGLMSGPDKTRPKVGIPSQNLTTDNNEEEHVDTIWSQVLTLVRNKVFLAFCVALALTLTAFNSFLIFFIDFFEQKGFDRVSVVWMYSGMNIVSTVFRFIPGLMAQSPKFPTLAIPAMYSAFGFVSLSFLPFVTSFPVNAVVIACYGMALGGVVTVISITTLELVGEKKYPTGLGMVLAVVGIANTVGAPIAGYFRDVSGSYTYSILSGAGSALLASLVFTGAMIYQRRHSEDPLSRFNMEIDVQARRKSRRRSSILPWRRSVDLDFAM